MAQGSKKKLQKTAPKKQQQNKSDKPAKLTVKAISRGHFLALFVILLISFLVYIPALHNGLVWDDEYYILNDGMIHSINLKQLFSSYLMGNYHPLTMLSYAMEYHFWGLGERGYHVTNIIIHLWNVILVFYAIFLLSNKPEVALVASLLFGVHPMHVESVAWVAERKDLLYTFFFLWSYICYLNYGKTRKAKFYFFSLLLFSLSLLSKAMAACLPVLLLLTDYFKEGKISIKALLEKIPFVILSIVFGIVAVFAQKSHNAVSDMSSFAILPRIVFASYGFIAYLAKLIVPMDLSAYYPYPVKGGNTVPVMYYMYPVLLIVLTVYAFYSLRKTRKIFFGMGFFAITVFLVLQLLPVGDAVMADRYSYVPSIGIFYLVGEGFYWLWSRAKFKFPVAGLLIVMAAILSFETYARCAVWKDGMSLWNDVISHYQTIPSAYNNRGKLLEEEKNYDQALSDLSKAIELDPYFSQAFNNRGALLMDLKRYEESNKDFDRAIELQPNYAYAYNNRGMLLTKRGKLTDALNDYNRAIELKPDFMEAYFNRGVVLEMQKKHDEALSDYNKVIELNPNYVLVYDNLGNILMNKGKYDEALNNYNKSLELDPNSANTYLNIGTLFTNEKKYDNAISNYTKAIELAPENGMGYYNRAIVENSINKKEACCSDLQRAINLKYSPAEYAYSLFCHQ